MLYRFSGKISPLTYRIGNEIDIKFITDFYMRKRLFCLTDKNLPYSLYVFLKNKDYIQIPISSYNGVYFIPVKNNDTLVSYRYESEKHCNSEMKTLKNLLEIYKKEG